MVRSSATVPAVREDLERRGVHIVEDDGTPQVGLLLFDVVGPELEGALREWSHAGGSRIIAIALHADALSSGKTWRLLAAGAKEVVVWQPDEVAAVIAARSERWNEVDRLLESPLVSSYVVGGSPVLRQVLRQIVEVAVFTTTSVLLLGESGTGKEQVARLIHSLDRRPDKGELITVDSATIVPELSGSEFFGHERGAFTGAASRRDGAFALAHKGTLFLDEVGELPEALQAQLLRVVQERTYKRVGGNQWFEIDFRLISATNRDLPAEVERKGFRADFFYRIGTWTFRLPPLRERREHILPLAEHFARQYLGPAGRMVILDERVCEFLLRRDYPGNVRELRQVVERLCARHVGGGPLTAGDIPPDDLPPASERAERRIDSAVEEAVQRGFGLKEIGQVARDAAIRAALSAAARNVPRAAKMLKVTDRALQMELAKRQD
ncbi:sigma 54-interacting transcriptional regulator [Pendulispora rubella]|uniref:Sigma 54-interacting transcriptional regulator n=1 Tax=Pendulispora rubella TaxID=2741070 RepID=A0ABZ2LM34_9BACT